jgi:hypothetical protein
MADSTTVKKTFLRSYDYDQCVVYGSVWTVNKAIDYFATYLVNGGDYENREQAFAEFLRLKSRMLADLKESIREGALVVNEEYDDSEAGLGKGALSFDRSHAAPFVFIDWAISKGMKVPAVFARYVDRKEAEKARYYEGLGIRMSTIHHERSRAIAELLWSKEPGITIAQMAKREEIVRFGCEGHEYDARTISRWLASLKVERPMGRPRKSGVRM